MAKTNKQKVKIKTQTNGVGRYRFIIVVLLLLSVPSIIALLKPGFFPTHDYIYVARIQQMYEALADGQFPVRWVSGFRYGDPTFNFYAPLPYYFGALVHAIGYGYLQTAKILYGLSFFLSALTMYYFGKELFGKWGGLIAAMLYLYAPYRSLDVYVRGALSETLAFVFLPLIFLFALKLSKDLKAKYIVFLSLSLAGLLMTHNIMTLLFAPFFVAWIVYLVYREGSYKILVPLLISVILGFTLASTYLLPALFERHLIQTKFLTEGYFDFRAHFVGIKQFIIPSWGYGASLWGPVDDMSMQLGIIHWLSVVSVAFLFVYGFFKRKSRKLKKLDWLIIL